MHIFMKMTMMTSDLTEKQILRKCLCLEMAFEELHLKKGTFMMNIIHVGNERKQYSLLNL